MKNSELIKKFFNGATRGSGSNMRIEGNELIEWATTLAERTEDGYILNDTKYSRTTSRGQGTINYYCPKVRARIRGLSFGARHLAEKLQLD